MEKTLVCGACGYQWDEECKIKKAYPGPMEPAVLVADVFELDCPVCDANMVNVYAPEKEEIAGDYYDGLPWF